MVRIKSRFRKRKQEETDFEKRKMYRTREKIRTETSLSCLSGWRQCDHLCGRADLKVLSRSETWRGREVSRIMINCNRMYKHTNKRLWKKSYIRGTSVLVTQVVCYGPDDGYKSFKNNLLILLNQLILCLGYSLFYNRNTYIFFNYKTITLIQ